MNILILKCMLLQLDPHDVVKSALDGFYPYSYVDVPLSIREQVMEDDVGEWEDFTTLLLFRLVDEGIPGWRL